MKKPIAITTGEPKSINSEIIYKSWKKIKTNNLFLIGNFLLIKKQFKKLGFKVSLKKITSINEFKKKNILQILDVPLNFKDPFKIKEKDNNIYNLRCLDLAHMLANKGMVSGIISAPVDKGIFKQKYPGVTEYLAYKNNLKNSEAMMIYNKQLSVVPITTHIDIKDVIKKINANLIRKKILTVNSFFLKNLKKKPKIAILGINPHNSENRKKSIEKKMIEPMVLKLRKNQVDIFGPFPADTLFIKDNLKKFDVVIGMYHDQVLSPFKAICGFDGINITLGLKYIRVSPDHGTGKDLIGRNKANALSLINSIKFLNKINYVSS
ncbi:MAG: 4-hydroxythreonine-4-phosphate dehydrogenase [Pelagibacterales bacterium]|nr:4-hydroxythreonine-4-phosphate dehydrogenase [Pelagibacterales bacterium]